MKIDKENFFKIIDSEGHLSSKTREAYWDFFTGPCKQDFRRLAEENEQLFTGSGLHLYVATSLGKKMNMEEGEAAETAGNNSEIIKPIETPLDKETAVSWGSNDDVRGK